GQSLKLALVYHRRVILFNEIPKFGLVFSRVTLTLLPPLLMEVTRYMSKYGIMLEIMGLLNQIQ
ncbi:MAG: hypothetical protein ACXADY_06790, partial [Candidatus Hodarchaeales archaeon]